MHSARRGSFYLYFAFSTCYCCGPARLSDCASGDVFFRTMRMFLRGQTTGWRPSERGLSVFSPRLSSFRAPSGPACPHVSPYPKSGKWLFYISSQCGQRRQLLGAVKVGKLCRSPKWGRLKIRNLKVQDQKVTDKITKNLEVWKMKDWKGSKRVLCIAVGLHKKIPNVYWRL